MIRRIGLATIVTGLVLATGAQAATKITLQCIKSQRTILKGCINTCRSNFLTGQASCFGPGLACAQACQDQQNNPQTGCLPPVTAKFQTCINDTAVTPPTGCTPTLRAALQSCTDQGNQDPTFDVDKCANAGRLANLQCQLDCRASVDQDQLACSQQFSQCLAGCASCATPGQCPQ
jgi:hypothetical protein